MMIVAGCRDVGALVRFASCHVRFIRLSCLKDFLITGKSAIICFQAHSTGNVHLVAEFYQRLNTLQQPFMSYVQPFVLVGLSLQTQDFTYYVIIAIERILEILHGEVGLRICKVVLWGQSMSKGFSQVETLQQRVKMIALMRKKNSRGKLHYNVSRELNFTKSNDKLRSSRTALSSADIANDYTLRIPGEAFAFSQGQNKVAVAVMQKHLVLPVTSLS
ncbi:unnamed protein product [Fraxinus pennsylvanica]|uniref:Uncharacterized protein n=1 Tax=Fraxinus pennsylvanica TaxID=56036 RepID=A0AAD1ZM02_9LAMI|nr:unnamed protein product [Fraxinus pennsylvanica]